MIELWNIGTPHSMLIFINLPLRATCVNSRFQVQDLQELTSPNQTRSQEPGYRPKKTCRYPIFILVSFSISPMDGQLLVRPMPISEMGFYSGFIVFTAPLVVHGEGDCNTGQRWQPYPVELLRLRALRLDKGGKGFREEPLFEDFQGERRDHHARWPHVSLPVERGSLLLRYGLYAREWAGKQVLLNILEHTN